MCSVRLWQSLRDFKLRLRVHYVGEKSHVVNYSNIRDQISACIRLFHLDCRLCVSAAVLAERAV